MNRRNLRAAVGLGLLMLAVNVPLFAAGWTTIVAEMEGLLGRATESYRQGDSERAVALVNEAYFSFYEKEGMERAVLSSISGKRASLVEYQFSAVKKLIRRGAGRGEVESAAALLVRMLREDASRLQGARQGPLSAFLSSFLILLREGAEAILIVAAIVAYLVKSGNRQKTRLVYRSSLVAVGASLLTAVVFQAVFGLGGANREILEGATILAAVAVLFFVSHWMLGKAESRAWQSYIRDRVSGSLSRGSIAGLGAAAFLAVYREGAETVLFYQALLSGDQANLTAIGAGIAAAAVALAVVFVVVRYGSIRLPLGPFFLASSTLMYLLAIVFAGKGVRELQEADVLGATSLPGLPVIDALGVYPSWETIAPQILLVVLAVAGFAYRRWRASKDRVQADGPTSQT